MQVSSHKVSNPLKGEFEVPGDKSISHRALIFSALAQGTTRIQGLLESEDVLNTAGALESMGIHVERSDNEWVVRGAGLHGLTEPETVLDMGNSGTAARLLAGVVGARGFTSVLSGDASLNGRPMGRIIKPLSQMGISFHARQDKMLPMMIKGSDTVLPIQYESPVASAQIKSAILLAGLMAPGTTTVTEPRLSRDHTERMANFYGIEIKSEALPDGRAKASVEGQGVLTAPSRPLIVSSDPSAAAFIIAAAVLIEGSDVLLRNINLNPTRVGFLDTLKDMGADLQILDERGQGGEPVGDIAVKYNGVLKGTNVPATRVPSMIDEFPILSIVAACAEGETVMSGLEELRVKESDRLAVTAAGLKDSGVNLEEKPDGMIIKGTARPPQGGASIKTHLDHRIAMSFLVLGCVSDEKITIDDESAIGTSFPDFVKKMNAIGCNFKRD